MVGNGISEPSTSNLPISITWLETTQLDEWLASGAMNVPHLPETNQHFASESTWMSQEVSKRLAGWWLNQPI